MIIGLAGYAKAGKDTVGVPLRNLLLRNAQRVAFADALKKDLEPLVRRFGANPGYASHKALLRDLYVAYGAAARKFNADFWIYRAMHDMKPQECDYVVTDVRYYNEATALRDFGKRHSVPVHIVLLSRKGVRAANREEQRSIRELRELPGLLQIKNNAPPADVAARILKTLTNR